MKYLGNKISFENLSGRLLYSTHFLDKSDVTGKDILDVGCGFGWFTNFCLKNGCKSFLGIDIEDENLKMIREDFTEYKNADFINKSILDIDYENKFDIVSLWEVIEHLPKNSENSVFRKVYSSLKDNGIFIISTPYESLLSNLLDPAYWLIGHRHYDILKLTKMGLDNGFVLEKIEIKGKIWVLLSVLNLYISKWIFRRRPFFEEFFSKKNTQEYFDPKGYSNIFYKFRKITK